MMHYFLTWGMILICRFLLLLNSYIEFFFSKKKKRNYIELLAYYDFHFSLLRVWLIGHTPFFFLFRIPKEQCQFGYLFSIILFMYVQITRATNCVCTMI